MITGCSSGIGLVAANDLLRRGYHVIAACRKPQDVERMNQLGFSGVLLDLDDAASVAHAADEIIALCEGCLFGLFNNGGFGLYGPLQSISRQQLEQQPPPICSAATSSPFCCCLLCWLPAMGASLIPVR